MNKKPSKFAPEVRDGAVRLVREQRNEHPSVWAAVESIAGMIGCIPQTLHEWVKRDQVDQGERAGVTTCQTELIHRRTWKVGNLSSWQPWNGCLGSITIV